MLKVVIAEDEELIREGLKGCIDWRLLGMDLVGLAENGTEAITFCRDTKPDILITDIRMPLCGGLELIQNVKTESPETVVVIVSGYDDFEYAQKAIKLGVSDYFLKPIELDKLQARLKHLGKELIGRRKQTEESDHLKDFVTHILPSLRRRLYSELLYGSFERSELQAALAEAGLFNEDAWYSVVLVRLKTMYSLTKEKEDYEKILSRHATGGFVKKEDCLPLQSKGMEGTFAAVVSGETDAALTKNLDAYLAAILGKTEILAAVYGAPVQNIQNLSKSFADAREKLSLKQLFRDTQIHVSGLKRAEPDLYSIDYGKIEKALKEGDEKTLADQHGYMESYISGKNSEDEFSMALLVNYFMVLHRLSGDAGLNIDGLLTEIEKSLISESDSNSLPTLFFSLKRIALIVSDRFQTKHDKTAKHLIGKAKDYIHEHYADSNLSLEVVADFLELNPSYFSVTFKNAENVTYIEYLTQFRLIKAKELLKTSDIKIHAAAVKAGYQNPAYFNYLFRKYFNMTPMEFRNSSRTDK